MKTIDTKIRITALADQALRQIRDLKRELAGAGQQLQVPARSPFEAPRRDASELLSSVRGLASAFAASQLVQGAVNFTRQLVQARIESERITSLFRFTAGGDMRKAGEELQFVRRTTDELGLELASTAEQYGKLTAAAKGTRLEGQASREIFLALAKAATVYNFSQAELQGALTAVQQIISKGKVSAEELRGQLGERLPGAVQTAARALGVTTEELDKMLEKGELIADDFLPRFARQLEQELGTQAQAAARGTRQEVTRLSTAVGDLKRELADDNFAAGTVAGIGLVGRAVKNLTQDVRDFKIEGKGWTDVLGEFLTFSPAGFALRSAQGRRPPEQALVALVQEESALVRRLERLESQTGDVFFERSKAAAEKQLQVVRAKIAALEVPADPSDVRFGRQSNADSLAQSDAITRRRGNELIAEQRRRARAAEEDAKKSKDIRIAQVRQAFDAELELLQDKLHREGELNQQLYDAGLRDLASYLVERRRTTLGALDTEIAELKVKRQAVLDALGVNQGRRRGATGDEAEQLDDAITRQRSEVLRLEAAIEKKKRDQVDATRALVQAQADAEAQVRRIAADVETQIKQATGTESIADIQRRIQDQFKPLMDQMLLAGGDITLIERLVGIRTSQEVFAKAEREYRAVVDKLRLEERTIDGEEATTTEEVERRKAAARQKALPGLREALDLLKKTATSPEERQRVAELEKDYADLKQSAEDLGRTAREAARGVLSSGFTQFFVDVANGFKSAKEAGLDFLRSIVQAALNVVAQQLGQKLANSLIPAGGGGFLGSIGSFLASFFHQGGIVGASGGMARMVPALAWAGAPRYHTSGIVGLKPRERPIIALDGEEVLNERNPRHIKNFRSGQVNSSVTVNVDASGADAQQATRLGAELGRAVESTVHDVLAKQMRPGGILARG